MVTRLCNVQKTLPVPFGIGELPVVFYAALREEAFEEEVDFGSGAIRYTEYEYEVEDMSFNGSGLTEMGVMMINEWAGLHWDEIRDELIEHFIYNS